MPRSRLRWWRIASIVVVLVYWVGVAVGGVSVLNAVLAVLMPLVMWNGFWRHSSPLVRNARRREPDG